MITRNVGDFVCVVTFDMVALLLLVTLLYQARQ